MGPVGRKAVDEALFHASYKDTYGTYEDTYGTYEDTYGTCRKEGG